MFEETFPFLQGDEKWIEIWAVEPAHIEGGYWLWIDVRTESNHELIVALTRVLVNLSYALAQAVHEGKSQKEIAEWQDRVRATALQLGSVPRTKIPRELFLTKEAIVDHLVDRRTELARQRAEYFLNVPA